MPTINPDRLLADLRTLRSFGSQGNGVVRPSLSPTDMEARRWLCGRIQEAGLEARIDGISHDFAEDTSDADIVRGCQVMATAVASILTEAQAS